MIEVYVRDDMLAHGKDCLLLTTHPLTVLSWYLDRVIVDSSRRWKQYSEGFCQPCSGKNPYHVRLTQFDRKDMRTDVVKLHCVTHF